MLIESPHSTWRGSLSHSPLSFFQLQASLSASSFSSQDDHHTITIPPYLPKDERYPSSLHNIHILPLLNEVETETLLQKATEYASTTKSWETMQDRHVSYNTVDFAVEDSDDIGDYLRDINFDTRIFGALRDAYDVDVEDMEYLDLFCVSYEANEDDNHVSDGEGDEKKKETMDHLEYHRDGSVLSFTILLSNPNEFEGGGTLFEALRDVNVHHPYLNSQQGAILPPKAGYATLHSGKLYHGGNIVTKGQRIVMVGFVDIDERNIQAGTLHNAAKEWGRNDVRAFWNKRRSELLERQREIGISDMRARHPMWQLLNDELLPQKDRSCFGKGFRMPTVIMDRIERRAEEDVLLRRRLETEDELLREILLPRELRGEKITEGELIPVEWPSGVVEYDEDAFEIDSAE